MPVDQADGVAICRRLRPPEGINRRTSEIISPDRCSRIGGTEYPRGQPYVCPRQSSHRSMLLIIASQKKQETLRREVPITLFKGFAGILATWLASVKP
jgi:hypothetical protein